MPVTTTELTHAKLVIDSKADVTVLLHGKEIALKAEQDGTKTAEVTLTNGQSAFYLRVPGGSTGGLVTTFVTNKPLEFR